MDEILGPHTKLYKYAISLKKTDSYNNVHLANVDVRKYYCIVYMYCIYIIKNVLFYFIFMVVNFIRLSNF